MFVRVRTLWLVGLFGALCFAPPSARAAQSSGSKPAARAYATEAPDSGAATARALSAPRALAPAASVSDRLDHESLDFDVDAAGTIWVRGRTYKASFGAGHATYIPFFGSRAPQNYPLELALSAVTVGGDTLAFDADAPAVRDGDTIEFDRGAFRERYVLTPESIEQTFVFDELAWRGEINVSVGVETALDRAEDAEGFRFGNELGHVRYGRAFAFDDSQVKEPIDSSLRGSVIELTAPAALVERAVGAFVIDPVLTTFNVGGSVLEDEFSADTAYDRTNGIWLTVMVQQFSGADHDIKVARHTTTDTQFNYANVDITDTNWTDPAVANNNTQNNFLVVATVGVAPNREIRGRLVGATVDLPVGSVINVSDAAWAGDFYSPDVGGNPNDSALAFYCVVWERRFTVASDTDILARLVQPSGTLNPTTIVVDGSVGTFHQNPAISNSCGISASSVDWIWNVVWEDVVSSANRNILGARVQWNGSLTATTFTVASLAADERNPSCTAILDDTGGIRPWMVTYEYDNGPFGTDVRCRTLNNTSILNTFDLSEQFGGGGDEGRSSCDAEGTQFVVVYQVFNFPVPVGRLRLSSLTCVNGVLGVNEGDLVVSQTDSADIQRPRVVTNRSSGSTLDNALVVFDRDASFSRDVFVTGYDFPAGGPVTAFCPGDGTGPSCPCGNNGLAGRGCANSFHASGARLGAAGSAQIGFGDTLEMTVSNIPPNVSGTLFQGTSASGGSVFGDGLRCAVGTVIRIRTKNANAAGSIVWPTGAEPDISATGAIPSSGAVRYYQVMYRNSASFCTPATFNISNGLRVVWIP